MPDFSQPCWRGAHNWIAQQRENNKDWEFIQYGGFGNIEGLKMFLMCHVNDWSEIKELTPEIWFQLIEYEKKKTQG